MICFEIKRTQKIFKRRSIIIFAWWKCAHRLHLSLCAFSSQFCLTCSSVLQNSLNGMQTNYYIWLLIKFIHANNTSPKLPFEKGAQGELKLHTQINRSTDHKGSWYYTIEVHNNAKTEGEFWNIDNWRVIFLVFFRSTRSSNKSMRSCAIWQKIRLEKGYKKNCTCLYSFSLKA